MRLTAWGRMLLARRYWRNGSRSLTSVHPHICMLVQDWLFHCAAYHQLQD